ncbi:ribonuclease HII family protein [Lactobacillus selangorensis]|uniref:Ribonuclease HII n=1 Tax=Lactobacillus selangorensis TaxID=81857 RepID=A0A0R2FLQ9_9LACO|nr:ribonuclease HII [Lactobacillus selangorensis]KRN29456.1 ribonuclease HII family protein [Lactobacillus selangorensis]KRN34015.1 ribonuclease HII family protein [Lactobacillus selangorensis]
MSLTIAEWRARIHSETELSLDELTTLKNDPRAGVQQLLKQYQRHQKKLLDEETAFEQRLQFEHELWPQYPYIAGIDEVGRGPLAGPVVTAAVVLPHDFHVLEVNDSKQLSAAKREFLYREIMAQAVEVHLGIATNTEIDQENIYHATEIAMGRAASGLPHRPDYLLVDAMTVPVTIPQRKLIKGDARSISIGAASIVAKVVRDHIMTMYDRIFPGYDFADNAGYGTKKHLAGLQKLGITPIHRRSFAPVKKYAQR